MAEHRQDPDEFGIGRLFWLTSEAIVAADLEAERVVLWNPAAERIFGYTAADAIGMRLEELVPEELRAAHLQGIRRYRSGADAVLVGTGAVDVPAVTKSGDRRDIALTLTDVSTSGAGRHVLAVLRDVTQQRQAERELAAANQAMKDFVATASHDLRTPLATIDGYASLLVDRSEQLSEQQRADFLNTIVRSVRHASRLVGDLLTLSQIQAGALATRREIVDVESVARRAVEVAGGDCAVDVDSALRVAVDSDHLERMLINYLTNATRYGEPPISIVADTDGTCVALRVCDRGPGPPDWFRDRLFSTFARAETTGRDGIGLGLSIVRGLAEVNGGTAFYEQDPERGTCFGLRLPVGEG